MIKAKVFSVHTQHAELFEGAVMVEKGKRY